MSEAEPVSSIGEEWVMQVGVEKRGVDPCDPNCNGTGHNGIDFKEGCEPRGFLLEREGSETAEDKASDKDREPETDGAEEFGFSLGGG